ncbi:hypothetical protein QQ045_008838 [Rhodiola kirilowii]
MLLPRNAKGGGLITHVVITERTEGEGGFAQSSHARAQSSPLPPALPAPAQAGPAPAQSDSTLRRPAQSDSPLRPLLSYSPTSPQFWLLGNLSLRF